MGEVLQPGANLPPDHRKAFIDGGPGRGNPTKLAVSLHFIQDDLARVVGAYLPDGLFEQFGLEELKWQALPDGNHPTYIAGVRGTENVPQAIVTLDLSYGDVRFAGVGEDSKGSERILAVTYNGVHHRVDGFDLSIRRDEVPEQYTDGEGNVIFNSGHILRLPTDPNHQGHHHGFVTEAMVGQTTDQVGHHKYALKHYDGQNSGNVTTMRLRDMWNPFRSMPGYDVLWENECIRASYTVEPEDWNFTLPYALEKI